VIEFTPLTEDHLPLVEEWLGRQHVARWWRDPIPEALAEHRAGIHGREPTDYYLIVVDERPAGMLQTYLASDCPEWEEVVQVGRGVAGVDILIGEKELIGRGGPSTTIVVRQLDRDCGVVLPPDGARTRRRGSRLIASIGRRYPPFRWTRARFATSRSSRISTTGSRRSPTAFSS
jgi:Acetyltransferase (GNAT) domain